MRIFVSCLLFMSAVIFFGCGPGGDRMEPVIGDMSDDIIEQPDPPTPPEDMVLIPAGTFQMGSSDPEAFNDEKPVHSVSVGAFYIDTHEVTNAEYQEFVLANPEWQKGGTQARLGADENYLKLWNGTDYPTNKDNHPVVYVSWHAAAAYARWDDGKRLPTEAQWEKAARGNLEGAKYPRGDSMDAEEANYGFNVGDTVNVGQYPENRYGLYDMAGNVWEWCSNSYTDVEDSRVLRGGSWFDTARFVRVSVRGWSNPSFTSASIGFRCAWPANP